MIKEGHCTKKNIEKPPYSNKNNFTHRCLATYNSALMSKNSSIQRLPVEIDPFRLVEQGKILEGRIPLSDFPRIQEMLVEGEDELVDVRLEFTKTNTKLPVVTGQISVELQMLCNRCLNASSVTLEHELEVVLVTTDSHAEELQQGFDTWLVEDKQIFLRDFIEDEILLELPIVVAHDECQTSKELIEAMPEDEQQQDENPFAALKDLNLKK